MSALGIRKKKNKRRAEKASVLSRIPKPSEVFDRVVIWIAGLFAGQPKKKRYNYIRNPYAENGWYSLVLGLVSVVLTVCIVRLSVRTRGTLGIGAASTGLTAILAGIMGVWFGILALQEKEKNYLFARIGLGLSLFCIIAWIIMTR